MAGQLPDTQKAPPLQSLQEVVALEGHGPASPVSVVASEPPASATGHANPGHATAQNPCPAHAAQYVVPAGHPGLAGADAGSPHAELAADTASAATNGRNGARTQLRKRTRMDRCVRTVRTTRGAARAPPRLPPACRIVPIPGARASGALWSSAGGAPSANQRTIRGSCASRPCGREGNHCERNLGRSADIEQERNSPFSAV